MTKRSLYSQEVLPVLPEPRMQSGSPTPTAAGDGKLGSLTLAADYSRYVRSLLAAHSDLAEAVDVSTPPNASRMRERLNALTTGALATASALRRLRKEVMLVTIARDLAGLADLGEVVASATTLAEVAIEAASAAAHEEVASVYGEPRSESGTPQRL